MKLPIVKHPTPSLHEPSVDLTIDEILDTKTQKLIEDLMETLKSEKDGVGIASPQVGVNKRIIVIDDKDLKGIFVNPRITSHSTQKTESKEGCLSVPDVWGIVERYKKVHVKALDRQGKKVELKASGFPAVIFQHEIDHLDGILFIDRAKRLTQNSSSLL